MKNFFSRLDLALVTLGYDQNKIDFLNDVKRYIQTGACLQYKNKMLYLPLWGHSSAEMARILGVSDATARSAINRMSTELVEQFGYDFFDVVDENLPAAVDRFDLVKQFRGLDDLMLPGFKQFLPALDGGGVSTDISLDDCKAEALFLRKYTKKAVELELEKLDMVRLRHLLALVDGSGGASGDRLKLIKFLIGFKPTSNQNQTRTGSKMV